MSARKQMAKKKMNVMWKDDFSDHENEHESSSQDGLRGVYDGGESDNDDSDDSSFSSDGDSSSSSSSDDDDSSSSSFSSSSSSLLERGSAYAKKQSRSLSSSSLNASTGHTKRQFGLPRFQIRNRKRPPTSTVPSMQSSSLSITKNTHTRTSATISSKKSQRSVNAYDATARNSRRREGESLSILQLYKKSFQILLSKRSSSLLLCSIIIWLYVQYQVNNSSNAKINNNSFNLNQTKNQGLKQQIQEHLEQRKKDQRSQSAIEALGNAAGKFYKKHLQRRSHDGYSPAADTLPKNCEQEPEQTLTFINCNDVHELDLGMVVNHQKEFQRKLSRRKKDLKKVRKLLSKMDLDGNGNGSMGMKANMTNEELESMIREDVWKGTNHTRLPIDILRNLKVNVDMDDRVGYLGSGLWRQVWRLYPRIQHHTNINIDTSALSSKGEDAVLKIMKSEHDVNPRNFDRHRRDALVMERLTSNPHVVSGYGFCGNTVLTEFAGVTLDDFLKSEAGKFRSEGGKKDRDDNKDKSNFAADDKADGLPQTHMEHSAKWKNVHEEVTQQSTLPAPERYSRTNPLHKIELALDVMRGLEVMHKHHMVHADIQSKQFLMDPVHGIKLNDFNRCRLLPKHTTTGGRCKVKIPSAPGGNRSPEEYEKQKVDTKIDIFSAGNVLFYILTGAEPWGKGAMKLDIQRNVKKGKLPEIKEEFLKPGTVDAAISKIVVHAFAFKPENRWNATEIIRELQRIKEEHSSERTLEVK